MSGLGHRRLAHRLNQAGAVFYVFGLALNLAWYFGAPGGSAPLSIAASCWAMAWLLR